MNSQKPNSWVLVGAGLFNMILALRLLAKGEDVVLFEARECLDRNKTWSFHKSDLDSEDWVWLQPHISKVWPGYWVKFPSYTKYVSSCYGSVRAANLIQFFESHFPRHKIHYSARVESVGVDHVQVSGRKFYGKFIVDARGQAPEPSLSKIRPQDSEREEPGPSQCFSECGFQKFVGWDCHFPEGHGLEAPLLMDVQVTQKEGFRFLYCLPWSKTEILIEDTRYSLDPCLRKEQFQEDLETYLAWRWPAARYTVMREEVGCLPIPFAPEGDSNSSAREMALRLGVRGGFFHPTTGYSLAWALKVSRCLASWDAGPATRSAKAKINKYKPDDFYFLLNRLLFFAAKPEERWKIFEKFYRLPQDLLARFYAGQSTTRDKVLIFSGRPPVRVLQALPWFINSWAKMKNLASVKHRIENERGDHGVAGQQK